MLYSEFVKNSRLDASTLPAAKVLRMATVEGAQVLGMDHEIGSIEIGKQADLVLVDLWKSHLMPIITDEDNPVLWNLIFSAKGSDVNKVFVKGELVVDNGKLVRISDQDVLEQAMHQTHSLVRRRNQVKEKAVGMIG